MARMTRDTFRTVLDREVSDADTWAASGLREDQQRNLQYYLGMPMGNEVDGRSQVISWDVFETVEGAMPNFLEPFFSGDNIGEFLPRGPEDVAYAEQATEYVNYIIKDQNEGFTVFSDWFKDALLSRVGIVRARWVQPDPDREEYAGLTDEQLVMLLNEPGVEVIEQSASEAEIAPDVAQLLMQAGQPMPMVWNVAIKRKKRGFVSIRNIKPTDWIINRSARRLEDATLVGEFTTYTRSQLKEMGFPEADTVKSYDVARDLSDPDEQDERIGLSDSADPSLEEIVLFDGFIRCDYNGDGIAEWRRVLAGDVELENEETDFHEYAVLTPIKLPHRIIGMALADPAVEIQRLSSSLTRQYIDSLFIANNPKTYVNMAAKVEINDLIANRIGGVIRGTGPASEAVAPLRTALVATESLQGIEMAQGMRERRTGVTRYNQGLDADSLNKTATGVTKITNMADKRMLLILRSFAETGVRDLFKLILKLVTRYQDMETVVRLRNTFVTFDPRQWSADMDVSVDVGLGTGDRTETLMLLQQFGQFMQQAAQVGLVGPDQVYAFGEALAKNARIKGAAQKFMIPPAEVKPKAPEPTDAQVKAVESEKDRQFEMMKLKVEAQEKGKDRAMELEKERMRLQSEQRGKLLELAAGYLMGNAQRVGLMTQPPVNLMGGTQLDQNIQVPGVTDADLDAVAATIQGFADRFGQGGLSPQGGFNG